MIQNLLRVDFNQRRGPPNQPTFAKMLGKHLIL